MENNQVLHILKESENFSNLIWISTELELNSFYDVTQITNSLPNLPLANRVYAHREHFAQIVECEPLWKSVECRVPPCMPEPKK